MIRFQRLTSVLVLVAMIGAWCPPCIEMMQAASTCCTQPCDECACGFEATPADVDPAPAVVVASPLTLEPVLESSVDLASSYVAPRTLHGRTRGSDLPSPPSASLRLSLLSVYLI